MNILIKMCDFCKQRFDNTQRSYSLFSEIRQQDGWVGEWCGKCDPRDMRP